MRKGHSAESVFERHPRSTAIATAAVAIVLLFFAEAIVRVTMPSVNFLGIDHRLFAPAGNDGYGNAPGFSGRVFGSEVRIDREGFRTGSGRGQEAERGRESVVFVGDSVTFGVGVQDGKTFADLFAAAHPDVETINASVIGYSLEDYVGSVRRVLDQPGPAPRHVFVGFCLNDLSASSKGAILASITNPHGARPTEGGLVGEANAFLRERSKLYLVIKALLVDSSRDYFTADTSSYSDPEMVERTIAYLEEIHRMLSARGVSLTVLVLPYEYQFRASDQRAAWGPQSIVDSRLDHAGIDHIDLAPDFASTAAKAGRRVSDDYLFNDPMHLSPLGHAVVADSVSRWWTRNTGREAGEGGS